MHACPGQEGKHTHTATAGEMTCEYSSGKDLTDRNLDIEAIGTLCIVLYSQSLDIWPSKLPEHGPSASCLVGQSQSCAVWLLQKFEFEVRKCARLSVVTTKPWPLFSLHCSCATMFWCQRWRDQTHVQSLTVWQRCASSTKSCCHLSRTLDHLIVEIELTALWLKNPQLNQLT